MSQNMTKEAAGEYLATQVYAPHFFSQLTSRGLKIANEAEAAQLVQLAVVLNNNGYQPQPKVAQQAEGNAFLASLLAQETAKLATSPAAVKQASDNLLTDAKLLEAATLLASEGAATA